MQTTYHSIDTLKSELRNYTSYVRYKIFLQDRIEDLWYELSGVKGVRYDRLPTLPNPTNQRQLALMDKLDYFQSELHRVEMQIRYLDSVLDGLDEEGSELIRYVLIDRHTLLEAGERWYITNTAVIKRIDTALRKAVDKTFNH